MNIISLLPNNTQAIEHVAAILVQVFAPHAWSNPEEAREEVEESANQTTLSDVDLFPNVLEHLKGIRNLAGHPYEFYQKNHGRSYQLLLDGLIGGYQALGHTVTGMEHRCLTDGLTIQVVEQLTGAFQGNEVVMVEVGSLSLNAGTILDGLLCALGKRGVTCFVEALHRVEFVG